MPRPVCDSSSHGSPRTITLRTHAASAKYSQKLRNPCLRFRENEVDDQPFNSGTSKENIRLDAEATCAPQLIAAGQCGAILT